jgi:adhesin/invasin
VNPGAARSSSRSSRRSSSSATRTTISAAAVDRDRFAEHGVVAERLDDSTITVTVRDVNGNPVAGQSVSLARRAATTRWSQPGLTDPIGVATGTIASTDAETKTITAREPGREPGRRSAAADRAFVGDPSNLSALLTTATASPRHGVVANGSTTSTITVTVRDVNGNAVAGQSVALAATGSNNTLVQPGVTNAGGVATGTIASTTAETKTDHRCGQSRCGPGRAQPAADRGLRRRPGEPQRSALDGDRVAELERRRQRFDDIGDHGDRARRERQRRRGPERGPVVDRQQQHARAAERHERAGVATGTIATTTAETKTITATVNPARARSSSRSSRRCFVGDPSNDQRAADDRNRRAGNGVIADGTRVSTITVTVRDSNGNPVAARRAASRDGQQQHAGPAGRHERERRATGTIASITAETKTITAPATRARARSSSDSSRRSVSSAIRTTSAQRCRPRPRRRRRRVADGTASRRSTITVRAT